MHLVALGRDFVGSRGAVTHDDLHLSETIQWLCRAQDSTGTGGVATTYSILDGWLPPYPETTGYIIPTFLRHDEKRGSTELLDRAVRMGDWEISIQLPTGAVRGGIGINEYPIVFNTGQVIHGWVALFRKTKEPRFLEAASRAADWLAGVQDSDGKWTTHTPENAAYPYYTYVAWPMLAVHALTGNAQVLDAAKRNLEWTLRQARPDGWFDIGGFNKVRGSLTHFFGYTIHGMIESAALIEGDLRERLLTVSRSAGERALFAYERRKQRPEFEPLPLPATFDHTWKSPETFSCLTGNAQLAAIWMQLYQLDRDARFLNGALKMLDFVKSTQFVRLKVSGIRGAVGGSHPIWGKYFPLAYPNWAAKFFADALMLQDDIMQELHG